MHHRFVLLIAVGVSLALLSAVPSAGRQGVTPTHIKSISAAEFFTPTKVWTAHLSMSADAWQAMQPQNGTRRRIRIRRQPVPRPARRPQRRRGAAGDRVRLRARHAADR